MKKQISFRDSLAAISDEMAGARCSTCRRRKKLKIPKQGFNFWCPVKEKPVAEYGLCKLYWREGT